MKTVLVFAFLFVSSTCFAQRKFSTYVGIGIGGNIENRFTYYDKKDKGRLAASVAQYYNLGNKFSVGIEALVTGRLFSFIGGNGISDHEDMVTNSKYLNNNNMAASNIFVKGKYVFSAGKKLKPFIDMGFGITTFPYNLHVNGVSKLRKTAMTVSPEMGAAYRRFYVACKMVLFGETPGYDKIDSNTGQSIILKSMDVHQLYIMAGFRVF